MPSTTVLAFFSREESRRRNMKSRVPFYLLTAVWFCCILFYGIFSSNSTIGTNEVATFDQVLPRTQLARPPYADWVHGHWVRMAPRASAIDVLEAVKEYQKMSVPIDVVILQFWEDRNSSELFEPDSVLFPDFASFVTYLHNLNIRVVMTVDTGLRKGSRLFSAGLQNDFLLDKGRTIRCSGVEKGLVDYSNAEAVKWVHSFLLKLLKFNIDGVKVTALDAYFLQQWPLSGVKSSKGVIDAESWGQMYYYDTFDFGREVAGFDFVSMFRPVDSFGGFQYHSFGPQDISFSGWVGDHAISVEGFREALLNVFHSANRGYISFGVSIGGSAQASPTRFLRSIVEHQELFLRWTQLAAFLPLMENGGQGENHYPWALHGARSDAVLRLYRRFAHIHKELRPFFYSIASQSHFEFMTKMGKIDSSWTRVVDPLSKAGFLSEPESWDFLVGSEIFVAPIISLESPTSSLESIVSLRNVTFPSFGQWIPYLYDRQHAGFYPAKATAQLSFKIGDFPVFKRRGAVLPLHVTTREAGNGATESSEATTFVIDRPYLLKKRLTRKNVPSGLNLPDNEGLEFGYSHQEHGHGMAVYYTTTSVPSHPGQFFINLRVTPFVKPVIVAIRGVQCKPSQVHCSKSLKSSGYHPFIDKAAFFESIGKHGLRAFLVTEDEMWLYDPFASIGNDVELGPLEAL